MIEVIKFEKTAKGNGPTDHVDDLTYEQRLRDSVLKPNKIPEWIEDFKMTNKELEALPNAEGLQAGD